MTLDPDLAAVLAAVALGILAGLPAFQRSLQRPRRAAAECLRCGRVIVLGERTCDCEPVE